MQNFNYEVKEDADQVVVMIRGKIEHENSTELENIILGCIENGAQELVIDLYNTDFLPSICFGVLLLCGDKAKELNIPFTAIMKPHHATLARGIGVEQVFTLIEKE